MIKKIKFEVYENEEKEVELGKAVYKFIAESILERYISEVLKRNTEDIMLGD